jgi:hypothetical protein
MASDLSHLDLLVIQIDGLHMTDKLLMIGAVETKHCDSAPLDGRAVRFSYRPMTETTKTQGGAA